MKVLDFKEKNQHGIDKRDIYRWKTIDEQGEYMLIHKNEIQIPAEYQRLQNHKKIADFTRNWSWAGCGALVIAKREDGFFAMDGQHRLMASLRRSDIQYLHCLVFNGLSLKDEAQSFLDVNTGRKPLSSNDRHKAKVVSGDENSIFVQDVIRSCGLEISTNGGGDGVRCLSWCNKKALENRDKFQEIFAIGAALSDKDGVRVQDILLDGLWHLDKNCTTNISDPRMIGKLKEKGAIMLIHSAKKYAQLYGSGSGNIYALGMLDAINKNLRIRFSMKEK